MKFLARADDKFVEIAIDGSHRPRVIKGLGIARIILLWCTVSTSLIVVLLAFDPNHGSAGSIISTLVAAIQWSLVLKFDADLKLLKIVQKLSR